MLEIKFKNGSYIKSIDNKDDNARSKRAEEQITYWKKHPDNFVECVFGHKLHLYQRLWLKLFL